MNDPYDNATIEQYAAFMEEIKTRLDAIHPILRTLGKDGINPTDFLQAEFCILQVRFVCELIALASLAAHHSLGLPKDLLKSWNAERTFRALEDINPHCFPKYASITRPEGRIHIEVSRDIMDRPGLQAIYNQCGEMLHRGMIKHVLSGKERVYDLQQIDQWAGQIGSLLSTHVIMILETGLVLVVNLTGGPNSSVQVAIAKGGPAVYEPEKA
jgi:hypothetical protein